MSISWIGPVLLFVVISMGAVSIHFRDAILWRENQIHLDNNAIDMGQRDRAIFRKIHKVNERLKVLDLQHHVIHACARIPATASGCIAKDRVLEFQIRTLLLAAEKQAYIEWALNKPELKIIAKREPLNLRRKRCPICFGEVALEPMNGTPTTHLFLKNAPRDLQSGYQVRFGKEASYRWISMEKEGPSYLK